MRLKKNQKSCYSGSPKGCKATKLTIVLRNLTILFGFAPTSGDGYRDRRSIELRAIQSAAEHDALSSGLAIKAERVRKLQMLAAAHGKDLFGGFLWTNQVKALGSGEFMKVVDYEGFNTAEVQRYRGVPGDIAKVGDRKVKSELTGKDGGPIETTNSKARAKQRGS